ncbi:MAG: tetratricopeptide repeat protein [Candidatus Poseidonia sp.]|uniref:tetratricopeptide repeat protein n=1 Tax=Poseidonia sp. TaxID=2666344 RepID=UPI0030C56537|nr:tetratricopeptide repeat protein [Poseidonia sp.]
MSAFAVVVGLTTLSAAGAVGYWMLTTSKRVIRLLDMQTLLRESQATHFHQLNRSAEDAHHQVNGLQETMDSLRAIHPEIDASLTVHAFLNRHEGSLESVMDVTETCHALESIVQHQSVEAVGVSSLTTTHQGMLRRLLALLDAHHHTMGDLRVNSDTAHRLGLAALNIQHHVWAESALGVAYQRSPGHASIVEGLEYIARLRGDEALQRHWLEARMKITPDDPALLRSHAHLLASMGDEEAERAVRRLEALGVDTAADRSLLSGLRARAGARSEALDAIEQALEEDPSRHEDWLSYALLLEADGELTLALEANERCLTLERQCGEAWALKARLLAGGNGNERDALKAATHAVALDAGGVDTIFLKSELLELEGSGVAAEETLMGALKAQPMNGELRARIAGKFLLNHRIDDAQELLSSTPNGIDHALLHAVEGRLHLAHADRHRDGTGQTDTVLLDASLKSFNGALSLDRELGVGWLGLARTQRMLGDVEVASESLARARRLMNDNDASVASESALLALDTNDVNAASSYIDAADVHGASATVAYVRGNIAARTGRLEMAHQMFTECLNIDPAHIRARLNRSSVSMAMNEGRSVLDDAEILLDMAPMLALARVRKAEGHMMLGEWEPASKQLRHVLETAPHHTHALTQLAACYMSMDRPERAESPLNEALRHSPDHAPAWHQRGLLYLEWSKIDNALSDFEAAVRCDGQHLDARLHIAALLHNSERLDEAEAAWRAVLAIDPDHTVAKTRLAECGRTLMSTR